MADNKPEEIQDKDIKSASVSNAELDEIQPGQSDSKSSGAAAKKHRIGPWLFLLLIFIGLPVLWVYSPPELRQQAMQLINPGKPAPHATQQTQPTVPPAESMVSEAPSEYPAPEADVQPVTAETPAETTNIEATADIASEAAPAMDATASLQQEIDRLQAELTGIQAERDQLLQQARGPQTIELHVWMGLLINPDTRLSQRAGMWAYLASRPRLDAAWKDKAARMAALLDRDRDQLRTVSKTLKQLADGIPETSQTDIIPKPGNAYFAWLAGTFHLRPAASSREQDQNNLRQLLLNTAHALDIEDWPDPKTWRQLLGALHDQSGGLTDTGLPESLGEIMMDIDASRRLASEWRETL